AAVDTKSVDKTPGFKAWDVTSVVQGWLDAPSTNFGLLLNSDPSKLRDRYRTFSSSEDPVAGNHPSLTVVYTPPESSPPPPPPPPPPEAQVGQWSAVFPAPIVQLHVHLLTDGTVLSWGRIGDPQVWDPATGSFTAVPSPSWLFCAGHDFLPDGRLLVAGGHITDGPGLPNTNLFNAGEEQPSRWLDVTGTGQWTDGPRRNFGPWRDFGSAVMYLPGKILYAGGGNNPPTNTAEIIDLNRPSPTWANTGSMAYARRQ